MLIAKVVAIAAAHAAVAATFCTIFLLLFHIAEVVCQRKGEALSARTLLKILIKRIAPSIAFPTTRIQQIAHGERQIQRAVQERFANTQVNAVEVFRFALRDNVRREISGRQLPGESLGKQKVGHQTNIPRETLRLVLQVYALIFDGAHLLIE